MRYRRSARLLHTTLTLLPAIAALATHGGTSVCVSGHSAPAASGMAITCHERAGERARAGCQRVTGRVNGMDHGEIQGTHEGWVAGDESRDEWLRGCPLDDEGG